MFDGPIHEVPVLAIDPDKVERIKSGATMTVGKNKLRLRCGITLDTDGHHNMMPKRMAGKRKISPSPGSKSGMCYVAAGNERIKNEGEITFDFESLEGNMESFVFQIAAVNKALGSGA